MRLQDIRLIYAHYDDINRVRNPINSNAVSTISILLAFDVLFWYYTSVKNLRIRPSQYHSYSFAKIGRIQVTGFRVPGIAIP